MHKDFFLIDFFNFGIKIAKTRIMSQQSKEIKIFLAQTSSDTNILNQKLSTVLQKAGFKVAISEHLSQEEHTEELMLSHCSVHVIGDFVDQSSQAFLNQDFSLAQEKNSTDENFTIFVWHPETKSKKQVNSAFINQIRNKINQNMIFSNHESAVMFVEDLRGVISVNKAAEYQVKKTEIFLIYNSLDSYNAKEIIEMLQDVSPPETLVIEPSSRTDYEKYIAKQVNNSMLTVVYFKYANEWAIPFMQQIWKISGGASIPGQFLLIASKNTANIQNLEFEAPKTSFKIVDDELIPLEIKVVFDKISKHKHND